MAKERIDRGLADAGWEADDAFSEQLAIGNHGDLCVIVPSRAWGSDDAAYELYDVRKNVSYWVREIPTPRKAAQMLQEHGGPPEEERGNPHKPTW